jgi:hypothetical protein
VYHKDEEAFLACEAKSSSSSSERGQKNFSYSVVEDFEKVEEDSSLTILKSIEEELYQSLSYFQ